MTYSQVPWLFTVVFHYYSCLLNVCCSVVFGFFLPIAFFESFLYFLQACVDGETFRWNLSFFLGRFLNICVRADMVLTRDTGATHSLPYYKREIYLVRNVKRKVVSEYSYAARCKNVYAKLDKLFITTKSEYSCVSYTLSKVLRCITETN